jgi:hypothetical protein
VSSPAPYDWDLAETEFDSDPTPLGTERPAGWEPPGRGNALAGAFVAIVIEAVVVLAVLL